VRFAVPRTVSVAVCGTGNANAASGSVAVTEVLGSRSSGSNKSNHFEFHRGRLIEAMQRTVTINGSNRHLETPSVSVTVTGHRHRESSSGSRCRSRGLGVGLPRNVLPYRRLEGCLDLSATVLASWRGEAGRPKVFEKSQGTISCAIMAEAENVAVRLWRQ
jgi:hypothetical protein